MFRRNVLHCRCDMRIFYFIFRAQERLEQDLPSYFLTKPDEYSIDDLVNIKNGEMKTKLKFLVDICLRHTSECKVGTTINLEE